MRNRCFLTLILLTVFLGFGCAKDDDTPKKKSSREKAPTYLQQTGSTIQRKLDLEDEEAEAKKKAEKKKQKTAGKVDDDFVLRGGFR
jgi:nucleosome binding factor SPN SPT16 subunit